MKKNGPFRPDLKMKQLLQKLIFLWLILSITFSKTLVYHANTIYLFFSLAKTPCIILSSYGLWPQKRGGKGLIPRRVKWREKHEKTTETTYAKPVNHTTLHNVRKTSYRPIAPWKIFSSQMVTGVHLQINCQVAVGLWELGKTGRGRIRRIISWKCFYCLERRDSM